MAAPTTARIGSEGDDVQGDVERLRGGSGADELTGDGNANVIHGLAGPTRWPAVAATIRCTAATTTTRSRARRATTR